MTDYNVVLGLQSTADWSDPDYVPGDYREAILRWWPNGDAPLTAMTSKMPKEVADDYEFNWFTEGLMKQSGDITGIYNDSLLSHAYVVTEGAIGEVVYVKMAAALAKEFRRGHTALLRDKDRYKADTFGKIVDVSINGASSYVAFRFLEADDNDSGHAFDYIMVVGSSNPQASESVDVISYQPVKEKNNTQIFRDALEIAGTTLSQKLRLGEDWYNHEKTNCLRMHSIQMEKAFLWGVKAEWTGDNGKPEYTTGGLIPYISTNKYDYTLDTDYSGKTWLQGGEDWFIRKLTNLFKYGGDSRMCFAGSGAILGINELARYMGNVQITSGQAEYGIKVMTYVFPFGEIHMKRHPLFSYEPTNWHSMLFFDPRNLKYRYMKDRDTHFRPDKSLKDGSWTDRDAIKEGYLTECGLEYHIEPTFGYFNGVGKDNSL